MAVKEFIDDDGGIHYRVYVQARGKINPKVRKQKLIERITSKEKAEELEKKWLAEVTYQVARLEGRGLMWEDILHRWELDVRYGGIGKKVSHHTVIDHVNRLRRFCYGWKGKVASDITRADGRAVIKRAVLDGKSVSALKKIKNSINIVFRWGIEEGFILGHRHSPVHGLTLDGEREERFPPILTLEEVKLLLREAKVREHPFYLVWAFMLMTGMRSGECWALLWEDVDLVKRLIRVNKSYSKRYAVYNRESRGIKSTKNGRWRHVPISDQLMGLLAEIKEVTGSQENVLPRLVSWKNGDGPNVLRDFLRRIGIDKKVVLHTLRACFATHLMGLGVEPTKVMKVGGWSDYKTFQIYVRLSGIEEKGATDKLDLLPFFGEEKPKMVH